MVLVSARNPLNVFSAADVRTA